MPMFLPLRTQSCYSMLDSTIEPKALAKACAQRGFPAVALTDRGNLFAAMAFSRACMDVGVQPLIGVALPIVRTVAPGSLRPGTLPPTDHLPLIVQNDAGWRNLLALVSAAHLDGEGDLARLDGRTEGLLALTGGADGALTRLLAQGQTDDARALALRLQALFGDRLFVEISRTGDAVENASEAALVALAYRLGAPLVATSIARFLEPEGHEAHDVMLCIADGAYVESPERRRSNALHVLPASAAEMALRFADMPEAIANCALVARRCAFALKKREPVLPKLVPDAAEERRALQTLAAEGLAKRLTAIPGSDPAPYRERLDFELGVIEDMGFPGYFLIVADFIHWAKAQKIPVGPGRGSGAGSVVAWALSITDLDPLPLGLIFERFLNPARKSMPDFDIDFCETRREEVIRYVQQKYGREQVAQIITFGTLKARAVIKDVGRVMQLPYGQVDRLSKLIPASPADPWDLERALAGVPELTAEMHADPKVAKVIRIARQLEGRPRHASTHAAGVVIGDRPLAELVPLYRDPRSDFPVTQFDLKWAEEAGLVKFDFLGLKTLSVLDRAKALLAARGTPIDIDHLAWEDVAVFQLMTRGDTVGVFQFESEGMRRALGLVRPTLFEDIIALGALYRPGPMDNIPSFAARKWGREAPDYLHPALEPILKPTYGVIIYQEQVMQIAQTLAGYSLGEADNLRRAMGKKIKAEMDNEKARFVEGAVERGVPRMRADFIFNLVEKFAGYGFNKSHAAAYAVIAWQTAWLKTYHPAAFYAASMAYDIHLTDKLAILVDDMRRLQTPLLPPCINASGSDFTIEDHAGGIAVRYALGALKGVGEAAMAGIVAERDANGPFRSLDDFVNRIDARAINKRQLEALAAAGAFECLHPERAAVFGSADMLLAAAARAADARITGQGGLFGGPSAAEAVPLPPADAWTLGERLAAERDAFGFWFDGHPVDAHAAVLSAHGAVGSADILARRAAPATRQSARMAGLVEAVRWRVPQGKGPDRRYMLVDLTDAGGSWGASCFETDTQGVLEAAAASGEALLFDVELQWREGDDAPRIALRGAQPLQTLARQARAMLRLQIDRSAPITLAADLAARIPRQGRSVIEVSIAMPTGEQATLQLGQDFALPAGIDADLAANPYILSAVITSLGPALRLVV